MQTLHIEAICSETGVIILRDLPIEVGDAFEIVVIPRSPAPPTHNQFPLRGESAEYLQPFEPVADDDWEAVQ